MGLLGAAGLQGARDVVRDTDTGERQPTLHGLERPTSYRNILHGRALSTHPSSCLLPHEIPGAKKPFFLLPDINEHITNGPTIRRMQAWFHLHAFFFFLFNKKMELTS